MKRTKLYRCWSDIKTRCYNKNHQEYKNYGGRGIRMCSEWINDFEKFKIDMGEPPTKNHQIDRIDSNGDYSKNNCRWVTRKQNLQNRGPYLNSSSIYKGVSLSPNKKKWISGIKINGKRIHLGTFEKEEDAALAYNVAAKIQYGEYAYINKIKKE